MIKAYAKINLSLFVTGLRGDGYHEIRSIFLKIGLFDTIRIIPSWYPRVLADRGPQDEKNIIWQALANRPYIVEIKKNIPIGAGLGGGSSDAAAVLKYFDKARALEKAQKIGSDVPFFIYDENAAVVEGRGEVVKPFSVKRPIFIVLYYPEIEFPTAEGYKKLMEKHLYYPENEADERIRRIKEVLLNGDLEELKPLLYNSFEEIHGEGFIEDFKNLMEKYGAVGSLMTGSGSAVFAIFKDFPLKLFEDHQDKFIFTNVIYG